jgi:AcrR family transcriptional regulator
VEVLRAAAAELAESGYAAFRIERVAAAAGVNRSTIYRRWPDKASLVEDAVRALGERPRAPDEGSLRADLHALLDLLRGYAESPAWRGVLRMIATESHEPEVSAMGARVRENFQAPWLECVERAKKRGELPAKVDARLVIDTLLGAIFFRFLRSGGVFDRAFAERVVSVVIEGAAHGGADA